MDAKLAVLLIEADDAEAERLSRTLTDSELLEADVSRASTLHEGVDLARDAKFDVVLLSLDARTTGGPDALPDVAPLCESVPVVVLLDELAPSTCLQAMREGAQDCLERGRVTDDRLAVSIVCSIERRRVAARLRRDDAEEQRTRRMRALGELADRLAHDYGNVLAATRGYAELALFTPGLDASLKEHLDTIIAASDRGSALGERVSGFGRGLDRPPHDLEAPVGSERVLIVNDDRPLATMVAEMLSALGYVVTTEVSSTEAWEMFQVRPDDFDLIIIEEAMPYMSGPDLCQAIRGIRAHLPIIITAESLSEAPMAGPARGSASAYLMKPYNIQQMAEEAREALGGSR